jgi:hypothetical protein
MNNIEETLWNYIDGTCTASEQNAISKLIDSDEAIRDKYLELLALNADFATAELDEPSMPFTYNVMEAIRTERAQMPLKATINKKVITGIAIFFGITILTLLVFTFLNINWGEINATSAPSISIKLPNIKSYISKPVMEGFLFFDTILALFLADSYFRKKDLAKHV